MSLINGVWHDAKLDPPPIVEEDVRGNLTLSADVLVVVVTHPDEFKYRIIDKYSASGKWLLSGIDFEDGTNEEVLYWMSIPEIPD